MVWAPSDTLAEFQPTENANGLVVSVLTTTPSTRNQTFIRTALSEALAVSETVPFTTWFPPTGDGQRDRGRRGVAHRAHRTL